MNKLHLALMVVFIGIAGVVLGIVTGFSLINFLRPCVGVYLSPRVCELMSQLLRELYNYAPLISLSYVVVVSSIAFVKKERDLLILLALTPGLYIVLRLPVALALWPTS